MITLNISLNSMCNPYICNIILIELQLLDVSNFMTLFTKCLLKNMFNYKFSDVTLAIIYMLLLENIFLLGQFKKLIK